jgi:hypothetical protein
MSDNINNSKSDFIRLLLTSIENDSSDEKKSREYLSSQGLNVDAIVNDQLKRIKQLQLKLNSEKTKKEMKLMESFKSKAASFVDQLFSQSNFSLPELIKKENVLMSFRNVATLDKEGVKDILIQHYTLKLMEEQKDDTKL